ncbi:hypothetical protein ACXET9_10770 [Brachybacterium sp. DNPG3]
MSAPQTPFPPSHPPYSAGPPQQPAGLRNNSGSPKILVIIGVVVVVLGLGAGAAIAVVASMSLARQGGAIVEHAEGVGTVVAEEGDLIVLYKESGARSPVCTAVGPEDGSVGPSDSSHYYYYSDDEHSWDSFGSFRAEDAGEYTVDCDGEPFAIGPPVSAIGVIGLAGGVLVALLGGIVGGLFLVIGVILSLVGRKRA